MEKLNIPLTQIKTTRRYNSRVVWVLVTSFLSATLALLAFHTILNIDTANFIYIGKPLDVIHLQKTPKLYKNIPYEILNQPIMQGSPVSFKMLLPNVSKNISLYLEDGEVIAISYSGKITNEIEYILNETGYHTQIYNNVVFISANNDQANKKIRFSIKEMIPWVAGSVINEKGSNIIKIHNKYILIRQKKQKIENELIINDSENLIYATISNNETIKNQYLPNELLSIIRRSENSFELYTIENEPIYKISLLNSELSTEELANLASKLINPTCLSTTALTIDKETTVLEIISNNNNLKPFISINDDTSFVKVENCNNHQVQITKTPNLITITNSENLLNISGNQTDLKTIIYPKKLTDIYLKNASSIQSYLSGALLYSQFEKIEIANSSIKIFW